MVKNIIDSIVGKVGNYMAPNEDMINDYDEIEEYEQLEQDEMIEEYDQGYEGEEEIVEEPRRISAYSRSSKMNHKNKMHTRRERTENSNIKMQIIKPTSYDEARDIIMLLKDKQSVVMNFEFVSKEDGRRIIDTVSGGVTALDGQIVKVSNTIFIAAPHTYNIRSEVDGRRKANYSYR